MVVDLFLVYQFIRRLATPFEKWEAYKLGIIDEKGKVLIKRKDFTRRAQRQAWGIFDIMIANLKKLLAKVPGGQTRLASYAAALFLIREWNHFSKDSLLTEDLSEEDLEESLNLFYEGYLNYITEESDVKALLTEKLKKSDDMGTWIKDFYDSDAPQFKGKSKEKRRKMAIAAKLAAMDEEIHPEVVKAYKRTQDAEHRDAEYGTVATKRAVTRTANTLSKRINQHHPDLDMNGKIKLRTQLQNMKEDGPCWDTHKQVGMKKKGNKLVPNCVPKNEGAFKRIAQVQSNKADRVASTDKKGLETYKKKPRVNTQPTLDEAATIRWKRAGANGEIQATIGGKKYQIEKALDHNERHRGEWKVMVWDKRRESWEWETTEYGKANAKAWITDRLKEEAMNMRNMQLINKIKRSGVVKSGSMSKDEKKPVTKQVNTKNELEEEPTNNVGSGNIAGLDGSAFSRAAQKRWTERNKSKKKNPRDMLGDKL